MAHVLGVAIGLMIVGGWFQHISTCVNEKIWGFLVAGAIFFPIAIINGWCIWLGFGTPADGPTRIPLHR
jgi:TRAP-type uncharacterized transport system fused permease subunit